MSIKPRSDFFGSFWPLDMGSGVMASESVSPEEGGWLVLAVRFGDHSLLFILWHTYAKVIPWCNDEVCRICENLVVSSLIYGMPGHRYARAGTLLPDAAAFI